jgi:anti-sigma factor RsiW
MQCAEARNWLFRKIDGELSDSENRALETHLAQCPSCTREYALLAMPRRIAQATPELAPSPFFYQKLKLRIEGEAREMAGWQVFWKLARQVVPALAGITLALLSVFAYFQLHGPEANFYRAYERVLATEEQPRQMLVAEQGDITDVSVLSAIAERESNHQHNK